MWYDADEVIAKECEADGCKIRTLYPRPADARVPEPIKDSGMYSNDDFYAMGWNDCRDEVLALLATPPAAKPEPAMLTAEEREWLEYAVDHMEDDSEPEDKRCAEVIRALLARVAAAKPEPRTMPQEAWDMLRETGELLERVAERRAAREQRNAAKPEQGDDPDLDGTEAAHPAWWRGHEYAAAALCRKVNEVLDGKDDGRGVANEPWEGARRRLLALTAEPEQGEPRWFKPQAPHGENPNVAIIRKARAALGPAHDLFDPLDHAATELAALWAREQRGAAQPKPAGAAVDASTIATWVCEARNEWAEKHEARWLETDEPHPDDYIGTYIARRLSGQEG
jgi:hypothetical protein